VYPSPSLRNDEIARLRDGTIVTVIRKVNGHDDSAVYEFYYVTGSGFTGWVLAEVVELNQ